MKKLNTANQCVHSSMIAWVHYSASLQRECFVYPQYLYRDGQWLEIEKTALPNNGSFLAVITGSADSQQIQDQYHSLVIAKVNKDYFEDNVKYEPSREMSSKYKAAINPSFYRGNSDLEFEVFSETLFSSELVQIVSSDSLNYSFAHFNNEIITYSEIEGSPVCQTILIKVTESGTCKFYGPFEYTLIEEGKLKLHALDELDFRIGEFYEISNEEILTVVDKDQNNIASFIGANNLHTLFEKLEVNKQYDWLPNTELVEVLCRAVGSMDSFKSLGKSQLRKMKSEIRLCSEKVAHLHLDNSRRDRINDMINQMDDLLSLDDDLLRPIVDQLDDQRLARIVTSDRLFPELQERLLATDGIRERIKEEEKILQNSLNYLNDQIAESKKRKLDAEEEVRVAREQAEKAKQEVGKVQEEILGRKKEQLGQLEQEIAEKEKQKSRTIEEYEQALVMKAQANDALTKVFEGINDEVAASTKIIESEVLKKVVAKLGEASLPQTDSISKYELKTKIDSGNANGPRERAEYIYTALSNDYGRECTYNDVVNYMICIMQGYITTFAGLPGTGKTSLCNNLCDVLGLRSPQYGNRFVEINVENGWTSYKDYIGYYNPLSKSYERANADVFDSMMSLSKEHCTDTFYPPFIYLLDEANLSHMEHYWSPFLRACDSFDKGTSLSLGGPEQYRLPPHIRFMATVNFDHTTETLSNRFLDRSWVIVLDPIQIDIDETESEAKGEPSYIPFTYNELMEAFGRINGEKSISPATRMQYEKIMRVCRDNHFNVSPRSQTMILNYVSVAEKIMETGSRDSQFAPLDYAIAQKILPLIYGPSDKIGNLMGALESECGQLQVTQSRLNEMKRQGDESGFYQFFA